jgi:hypothetical protein
MLANRIRAFALSTAFAIVCFDPPAIAAQFDGNWSIVAVTTSGHCGRVPIGLGISRGRITSTGGRSPATRFSWSAEFPPQGRCG